MSDNPVTEVHGHTVKWRDGLKVVRVCSGLRGQIVLWLTWQGVRHEVRLGQRVSEIWRRGKEDT